ncbi:MAG: aminoglycoside phosphotransferase family protein [Oscillospiraceae bacterium]|nr:aminoglycoside phosphotransferase family protein [Oscillospiraceae bacterium]
MYEVKQISEFQLPAPVVCCDPYGNGHINDTYLVEDARGNRYILQRINQNVFKDCEGVMTNIQLVTRHISRPDRHNAAQEVLTLVPCHDGMFWHVDGLGEYWRLYHFTRNSICFEQVDSLEVFRESGVAFGNFINQLADFDAAQLTETIPDFHNTPRRYAALREAVAEDAFDRAKTARREIAFALAREEFAATLINLQKSGKMPIRVTHNDAKLNNVLFCKDTRAHLYVIDLDTTMPGLAVTDFGDSIRFGAATGAEDERDLDKVNFSIEHYRAYKDGFLTACTSLTPCETEHLPHGAKMMALECGVRFLTDHLNGDTYFKIGREGHNLDRCRTQFKLVADMEKQWDAMRSS